MSPLEQWGMPLAVTGMLLAMLFMAAVLNRYQAHQARVRSVVARLDRGVRQIEEALSALQGMPLSRELRVALRGEVLARYQRIRKLHSRYPSIIAAIRQAETALGSEGPPGAGGVPPIDSFDALHRVLGALDVLIDELAHGMPVQPMPRDVRAIFCRELGERRAEAAARFHLVQARQLEEKGDVTRARGHLTTLMQLLRTRGPSTEFVRELYAEAESALAAMTRRQLGQIDDNDRSAPLHEETAA